jgi:hypothetical protein
MTDFRTVENVMRFRPQVQVKFSCLVDTVCRFNELRYSKIRRSLAAFYLLCRTG